MKKILGIVFALLLFATGLSLTATSAEAETINYEELGFSPPDMQVSIINVENVIIDGQNEPKSYLIKTRGINAKVEFILNNKLLINFTAYKNRPGEGCNNKYLISNKNYLYNLNYSLIVKDYTLIGYSKKS